MVFPGWQAVLPVGKQQQVPVITHQQLMTNPRALELMVSTLLGD